jgi:hypothetical protein
MCIYSKNTCAVCDTVFKSFKSLSNHINKAHGISAKEYYDTYIAKESEKHCDSCNGATSFISVSKGYNQYCNKCSRSIGAKRFRKELKEDTERFKQFSSKVSKNQERIWTERVETGESEEIRAKIGNTKKETISKLTNEERIERFGWLNKVEPAERDSIIETITFPMINFWKNGDPVAIKSARERRLETISNKTPEEKLKTAKKSLSTRYNFATGFIDKWYDDKSSKELYYKAVWEYTEISYSYNKHMIDPHNLRGFTNGTEYHLDHIYSIMQGFIYSVDPKIIGHACNLQILSAVDNLTKSAECWIALEELNREIDEFTINNKNTWVAEVLNGI